MPSAGVPTMAGRGSRSAGDLGARGWGLQITCPPRLTGRPLGRVRQAPSRSQSFLWGWGAMCREPPPCALASPQLPSQANLLSARVRKKGVGLLGSVPYSGGVWPLTRPRLAPREKPGVEGVSLPAEPSHPGGGVRMGKGRRSYSLSGIAGRS